MKRYGCSKGESPRGKALKKIIKVTEGSITTDGNPGEWKEIEALTLKVGSALDPVKLKAA